MLDEKSLLQTRTQKANRKLDPLEDDTKLLARVMRSPSSGNSLKLQ